MKVEIELREEWVEELTEQEKHRRCIQYPFNSIRRLILAAIEKEREK